MCGLFVQPLVESKSRFQHMLDTTDEVNILLRIMCDVFCRDSVSANSPGHCV